MWLLLRGITKRCFKIYEQFLRAIRRNVVNLKRRSPVTTVALDALTIPIHVIGVSKRWEIPWVNVPRRVESRTGQRFIDVHGVRRFPRRDEKTKRARLANSVAQVRSLDGLERPIEFLPTPVITSSRIIPVASHRRSFFNSPLPRWTKPSDNLRSFVLSLLFWIPHFEVSIRN